MFWRRCSPDVVEAFQRGAAALGLASARVMPSGAGHDTQFMSTIAKSGMVFVASKGGVSHAPEEFSQWDDVVVGTDVFLAGVLEVAKEP